MEDSAVQEQINVAKDLLKTLDESRLEITSRTGLAPCESCIGESSTFDIIWSVTEQECLEDVISIIQGNVTPVEEALKKLKDKIVNTFMTLYNEHVVKKT